MEKYLSEHQRQSIEFFNRAIDRMIQEKLTVYDVFFFFQNYMAQYLVRYGLKIYIGSEGEKEEIVND